MPRVRRRVLRHQHSIAPSTPEPPPPPILHLPCFVSERDTPTRSSSRKLGFQGRYAARASRQAIAASLLVTSPKSLNRSSLTRAIGLRSRLASPIPGPSVFTFQDGLARSRCCNPHATIHGSACHSSCRFWRSGSLDDVRGIDQAFHAVQRPENHHIVFKNQTIDLRGLAIAAFATTHGCRA